jgi:hypothetical protein
MHRTQSYCRRNALFKNGDFRPAEAYSVLRAERLLLEEELSMLSEKDIRIFSTGVHALHETRCNKWTVGNSGHQMSIPSRNIGRNLDR